MKVFSTLVALASLAATALAQSMSIDTPAAVVQCQPVALTWRGGTPPYFLSIIPGGQVSAAALIDFGQLSGTTLTWTANITAGTSITLKLTDSTGSTVYSSPITILSSSNSACIGGGAAVSQSSVASSASSAATTTVGSTTASSAAPSTTSAAAGGSSSASSSAVAATSSAASAATSRPASASSAASSAVAGVSSAASSAAAAATSAASGAEKLVVSGLGAFLLSAVGIVML
ncbi:hypothetical protein QFC20_004702 [Naganishia adeliensis]|uniref:Uncharacterized protein n=1 Tax=Naganishia adeliensis TaxID=92952 RepID=A0ACC2VX25_9TREE|nr:hypothetical protein QFC20_004702 [Naganishia adeliensis]